MVVFLGFFFRGFYRGFRIVVYLFRIDFRFLEVFFLELILDGRSLGSKGNFRIRGVVRVIMETFGRSFGDGRVFREDLYYVRNSFFYVSF